MTKKQTMCVMWLFFLSAVSFAQGRIEGYVVDDIDGNPIAKAQVQIENLNKGTLTNDKGYFVIENLSSGKHVLQVSHIIYYTWKKEIVLKEATLNQSVKLIPRIYDLQGVEIKEQYTRPIPYVRTEVKREQIELVATRDIGDFMRSIPNVGGIRKGGGNLDPVVRGMKFDQLIVQMNGGQRIEGGCPNRMDPTTSHIEMEDIESIEILKGPYALRYGPVFGGIVNLKTISPKPYAGFQVHVKGIKGYESNWNGNKEHLELLGGNERIYFAITGNNLRYGNYLDGRGERVFTQINRFGYAARLGMRPLKNHEAIFTYAESYARSIRFPVLPMDERVDNTLILGFDYTIRDLLPFLNNLQLKVYSSDVYHEMDNYQKSNSDTMAAVAAVDATKWGYRLEAGLNFGKSRIFVGTDYENVWKDGVRTKYMFGSMMNINTGAFLIKPEQLWNNAGITNQGIFSEYRYKLQRFEFMLAGRFDMNNAECDSIILTGTKNPITGITPVLMKIGDTKSSFNNISFSGGVTHSLTDQITLSLMAGRGTRSPNMLERFIIKLPVGYDNFEYMGNPLLEPETNTQIDFSVRYENSFIGHVEAGVFYSVIDNYISGVPVVREAANPLTYPFTISVYGVKQFANTGTARLNGYEFQYKTPEQYKWGAIITLAATMGTLDTATAPVMKDTTAANFMVSHFIKVENDYMPEIPPLEAKVQFYVRLFNDKLVPRISYRWVAAQNNASLSYGEAKTPSFNLLDLSLQYKHNSRFTLNAGINNLMDKAYYEHLNRRILGSTDKLYEPGRVIYASLVFNI